MRLHFQSVGEGEPLVILHGLFGSADNWRHIAKALSTKRRVISVDLRNHGRSFHHARQTYPLMADDLHNLLDDLGLGRVDLLGHSLGGKVAIQFAQSFTERLASLIVVDIAPRQYADEHSHIFKSLMALDLGKFTSRTQISDALSFTVADPVVRQFLLLNLQKENGSFRWRINLDALFCSYPGLLQQVVPDHPIQIPTMFICGANSSYVTQEDWQQIQQLFPQVRQVVVDGAGHWVHADQPEIFLQQLDRFLTDA